MKIICLGNNYRTNNTPASEEPLIFMKPETSLVVRNRPFFVPDFSNELYYELELVLHINKVGKHIQPRFAHTYYDAVALGLDFTAVDILRQCQEKGLPWETAKAFDYSAPIGEFIPKEELGDLNNLHFQLMKNGECVQDGNSSEMILNFDRIISYVSQYVTLKMGDLIFTGTPAGAGPVKINDFLEGYLNGTRRLRCRIK